MQDRYRGSISVTTVLVGSVLFLHAWESLAVDGRTDISPEWFCPSWAVEAKYNKPIAVGDTDSALGRYSLNTNEIGLKDLVRFHGHRCNGLVAAFVEIRAVLENGFVRGHYCLL